MKRSLSLILFLLWMQNGVIESYASCACAAKKHNFEIDCGDSDAVEAALSALESNSCLNNCEDDFCARQFYILHSHHDYCLPDELSANIKHAFRTFREVCKPCHIFRKYDERLRSCPSITSCERSAGDQAIQALKKSGCNDDCSLDGCDQNYRILRSFHGRCHHQTSFIKVGITLNSLNEPCQGFNCNIFTTARESMDQLVCSKEQGGPRSAAGTTRGRLFSALTLLVVTVLSLRPI